MRTVAIALIILALESGSEPSSSTRAFSDPPAFALRLYAGTQSWLSLATHPALSREDLASVAPLLQERYAALTDKCNCYDAECNAVTQLLSAPVEGQSPGSFRWLDVNGDAVPDIVYSGADLCREGSLSLIFFGPFEESSHPKDQRFFVELLRIRSGPSPAYLGYDHGCCGDPTDRYILDGGSASRQRIAVSRTLTLPRGLRYAPRAWSSENETILRDSPHVDDRFDKEGSEVGRHALFGNVLVKCLPGARGRLIGTFEAPDHEQWGLVHLSDESLARRYYDQTPGAPVDVGWVRLR